VMEGFAQESKGKETKKGKKGQQSVTDTRYLLLKQTVNTINNRLLMNEFAAGVFSKLPRPPHGQPMCPVRLNSELKMRSPERLHGVMERAVASETLVFMIKVLDHIQARIQPHLPQNESYKLERFSNHVKMVSVQFTTYMYRNICTFLLHMESITDLVQRCKWNKKGSTPTEANTYVQSIVSKFQGISKKIELLGGLPAHVEHRLLKETLVFTMEGLVSAWATLKHCSIEGRAQMTLDRSELAKGIQKIRNVDPMPSWEYVQLWIDAFYLPRSDLLLWIQNHASEYPMHVHQSFATCGRASQDLGGKQTKKKAHQARLVEEIKETVMRALVERAEKAEAKSREDVG
jgi:hypothetical protein